MKKIHYLWEVLCWCLLFSAGACTTELDDASEVLPTRPETGRPSSGGTRSFNLQVRNKLATGTPDSRANGNIALNAENEITAMDLYVFGSESEYGEYTFQEKLSYRAGQQGMPEDGATPFVLVTNGADNAYSSARLEIKKGLYVKLYCVANAPKLYVLDDADKTYKPAKLTPLVMEMVDSEMKVKTPGTPEKDFLSKFAAQPLEATNPEDVIRTPLLMVGNMAGCISLTDCTDNSIINTSLKLTRGVARFDVQNDAEKSRLVIESLSMTKGHATTTLFPLEAKPLADGSLLDYPQKFFYGGANDPINKGLQEAAFYSFAAPQEACLLLSGTYTTPGGDQSLVKYQVPFHHLKDGNGQKITIQPNHRYTVKITDADPYEVKLSISVADWDEGGNLDDYNPGNANQLHFAAISLYDNLDNNVANEKHVIRTYNANANGVAQGTITFHSNSAVTAKVIYKGGSSHEWLQLDAPAKTVLGAGAAYSHQYVFTVKVKETKGFVYPPATVVFQNATGEMKKLELHSRELYQGSSAYTSAYRFGHDNKYYLIAHADGNYASGYNQQTARTKCREEEGWRLPSFNDLRQLFKIYEWDTKPYLVPGTAAYQEAFSHAKTYSYNANPSTAAHFGNVANNILYSNHASQSFPFVYDAYYWTSDVNPSNANQGGTIRAYNGSTIIFYYWDNTGGYRVRCIKDWN